MLAQSLVLLGLTSLGHSHPFSHLSTRQSSCGPVAQFYNPDPSAWQHANTDAWLEAWWNVHADDRTNNPDGFAAAFGQYALGNPSWSCKNSGSDTNCDLQPCDNSALNGLGNGTEQAFYVLQAITRLHGYFLGLDEAFDIGAIASSFDNNALVENFWWDENNWDGTILKEMLNLFATIFAVGAVAAGPFIAAGTAVGAGIASGMLGGSVSAMILGMSSENAQFSTAASVGHLMSNVIMDAKGSFIDFNNAMMKGDSYHDSGDIRSYLKGGEWVNFPELEKREAFTTMKNMLQSTMINSLWRMQRVFILGGGSCDEGQGIGEGPMHQEGDNYICDEEGKAWYLYYWQRESDPLHVRKPNGWIARPWGSDRLGEALVSDGMTWPDIKASDAIKSSVKAWQVAGNNYDQGTFADRMADVFNAGSNPAADGTSMEGIWTIPVCDISGTATDAYDYDHKEYVLQPYGWDNRMLWCGPICGLDKETTKEFYEKANFKDNFKSPFLEGCNGKKWDWTTDEESG